MLDGHRAPVERAVVDAPALHALERKAQLRELRLLFFILLELQLKARLLFLHVERIIAGVKLRLAVRNFNDAIYHAVQKIPVMGNRQNRSLKARNIFLQPFHRVHVQMVGRLIQKQNVGLLQKQPCKIHPRLFSAGKRRKKLLALRLRNRQTVADFVRFGVDLISAAGFKAVRERVILRQNFLRRMLGHLRFQLAHASFDPVQSGKRRAQHVADQILRRIDRDLGNKPHLFALREGNRAGIIVDFARQNLKKRRLARAVFAEQPDALARLHVKADTVEQIPVLVKALDKVLYRNVNHVVSSNSERNSSRVYNKFSASSSAFALMCAGKRRRLKNASRFFWLSGLPESPAV